jgi:hypothetical protein
MLPDIRSLLPAPNFPNMIYPAQIVRPWQPVAYSLGSEMYVRVEINFKRTASIVFDCSHKHATALIYCDINCGVAGVCFRRRRVLTPGVVQFRQTAADSNSLPLYCLAFKRRWSLTLWLSEIWRHVAGTYLPTFRNSEVPSGLPSIQHAACHIQKICSFGLYCELHMPYLLT